MDDFEHRVHVDSGRVRYPGQEAIARLRAEVEALRADAQAVAALLPGPYYMDPPDGGSVTVIEQLRRMAADAARYRWLRHHSTYTTVTPCIHGEVAGPSRMRWYHDSYQLQAFTLDAAIDAARAAQGDKT
jgi:hypothetical protein